MNDQIQETIEYVKSLEDRVQELEEELRRWREKPRCEVCSQRDRAAKQVSGDLVIRFEAPESQIVKAANKPIEAWRTAVKDILNRVPRTEHAWKTARRSAGFHTRQQVIDTFRLLTRISTRTPQLPTSLRPDDIVDLLKDYRLFVPRS